MNDVNSKFTDVLKKSVNIVNGRSVDLYRPLNIYNNNEQVVNFTDMICTPDGIAVKMLGEYRLIITKENIETYMRYLDTYDIVAPRSIRFPNREDLDNAQKKKSDVRDMLDRWISGLQDEDDRSKEKNTLDSLSEIIGYVKDNESDPLNTIDVSVVPDGEFGSLDVLEEDELADVPDGKFSSNFHLFPDDDIL